MGRVSYVETAIANGAALSGVVDLRDQRLVGIVMPAAWTAADITFLGQPVEAGKRASTSGLEPFQKVVDDAGVEVKITAPAISTYIVLRQITQDMLRGLALVQVQSGIFGTTVNQGAARKLTLMLESRDNG